MSTDSQLRKQFAALRRRPGPQGWQGRAARDLGYSPSYVSRIVRGKLHSPAAAAAISEWKRRHKVA